MLVLWASYILTNCSIPLIPSWKVHHDWEFVGRTASRKKKRSNSFHVCHRQPPCPLSSITTTKGHDTGIEGIVSTRHCSNSSPSISPASCLTSMSFTPLHTPGFQISGQWRFQSATAATTTRSLLPFHLKSCFFFFSRSASFTEPGWKNGPKNQPPGNHVAGAEEPTRGPSTAPFPPSSSSSRGGGG